MCKQRGLRRGSVLRHQVRRAFDARARPNSRCALPLPAAVAGITRLPRAPVEPLRHPAVMRTGAAVVLRMRVRAILALGRRASRIACIRPGGTRCVGCAAGACRCRGGTSRGGDATMVAARTPTSLPCRSVLTRDGRGISGAALRRCGWGVGRVAFCDAAMMTACAATRLRRCAVCAGNGRSRFRFRCRTDHEDETENAHNDSMRSHVDASVTGG